jgi:hypothetical protein
MTHASNIAIKPAVLPRSEAALEVYGRARPPRRATLPRRMTLLHRAGNGVSFVDAQAAAREWADKALDLAQAGDTERARYAIFRAEACLVKMLALETQVPSETGVPNIGEDIG